MFGSQLYVKLQGNSSDTLADHVAFLQQIIGHVQVISYKVKKNVWVSRKGEGGAYSLSEYLLVAYNAIHKSI